MKLVLILIMVLVSSCEPIDNSSTKEDKENGNEITLGTTTLTNPKTKITHENSTPCNILQNRQTF